MTRMIGTSAKALDDYFTDWEGYVFGFGYGTGEHHVIPALRRFLELTPEAEAYRFEVLERELGAAVAWLFINILAGDDIIEYGTSARYAWLTSKGKRLRKFMLSKSADDLIALTGRYEDYDVCYPDACNCGPNGYQKGRLCQNPFFLEKFDEDSFEASLRASIEVGAKAPSDESHPVEDSA